MINTQNILKGALNIVLVLAFCVQACFCQAYTPIVTPSDHDIDIIWHTFNKAKGITTRDNFRYTDDADLTLVLSAFPNRRVKPMYPWLEITQFRSVSTNPCHESLIKSKAIKMAEYYSRAVANTRGSVSFEDLESILVLFGQSLILREIRPAVFFPAFHSCGR